PVAVRFSEQARRVPNGLAIADNKATWSYNELERRTNQLANYLVATGIQPEDVIAIYAHRNASLVWALLGILKAGGAFVILDPDYPDLRLIDYLRAAKPKGWIEIEGERTVPEVLQEFVKDVPCRVRLKLPSLATAQKDGFLDTYSTDFPGVTVAPDDRAYIAFTSGSTGKPKGILGPHGPLAHFFEWHIRTFELTETDRFSLLAGLSHDPCLRDIFTPLLLGATLFIPDPEKIASGHLADWLNEADISIAHVTPAMGQLLADDATVQCKSLRRIFFGGDTLREALLAKMTQLAPSASFVSFYGATETPQAMGYYLIPETAAVPVNAGQGKKIPLGRGIEDAQLLVLNGTPNLAGIGELGEICIRSPFLSKGYLDDEPMTLDRFVANPFTTTSGDLMYRTGDLGRYLPDGAVEFTGRADRQVKVRGFRIELEELESLLQDYPGVRQSVVVLRDDDSNDKRLVAYIVPERDQSLTVNELRDFLKQRLPGSMVPSSFILLDSFRLTPNGKIDRRALPACDEAGRITRAFVPPRNTTDERLVAIWAKLLGLKQIGIYDDFFELGGHSLLAVRLFAQIEKEFNKRLPLSILFQGATIEHLADLVSQRSPLTNPSSLVAIQPKGSKLPFFCVHELFGDVICYRNLAHHLGQDQPFYALQARGLDGTEEPFDDIEAMAAYYIDTIRTVQPHGPYVLGGLCFGGVVAFEMARQLRGNGESVALVALLDSGIGRGYGKLTWWWRFFQSLHRHIPSWLIGSLQLTRSQWSSLIKLKLTMAKTKLDSAFRSARGDSPQNDIPSRIRDLRDSFGFSERHYRVAQAQYRASRKYHPRLYPGPVALFRARMQPFFSLHSPTKGWDRVAAGGVEIRVIPGNHLGMLQEPHVRVLAKELTACLAKTTKTG
ncbi:MAG: amino acid adenylation domain-containing protein, partial [Gammaproteobacteria bacterium]